MWLSDSEDGNKEPDPVTASVMGEESASSSAQIVSWTFWLYVCGYQPTWSAPGILQTIPPAIPDGPIVAPNGCIPNRADRFGGSPTLPLGRLSGWHAKGWEAGFRILRKLSATETEECMQTMSVPSWSYLQARSARVRTEVWDIS